MSDNYTNTANANTGYAYGWDDVIELDAGEYTLLPEGDYNFEVTDFERGYYKGGGKLPACNKAKITFQVKTDQGDVTVKKDIFLHSTVERILSSFFCSIGEKKHGERMKMDWNSIIGKKGRAHFKVREYTDNEGKTHKTNDIDRFIKYDRKYFEADEEWVQTGSDDDMPF